MRKDYSSLPEDVFVSVRALSFWGTCLFLLEKPKGKPPSFFLGGKGSNFDASMLPGYMAVGQNPVLVNNQRRWQMDVHPPQSWAGSAPWPYLQHATLEDRSKRGRGGGIDFARLRHLWAVILHLTRALTAARVGAFVR